MLHGKCSDCLRSRLEVFLLQEEHDPRSPVVVHGHLCVESQHIRPTSEDGGRVAHVRRVCLKHRAHQVREESISAILCREFIAYCSAMRSSHSDSTFPSVLGAPFPRSKKTGRPRYTMAPDDASIAENPLSERFHNSNQAFCKKTLEALPSAFKALAV